MLKENTAFQKVLSIKDQIWEKLELGLSAPHLSLSASALEHNKGMIECVRGTIKLKVVRLSAFGRPRCGKTPKIRLSKP